MFLPFISPKKKNLFIFPRKYINILNKYFEIFYCNFINKIIDELDPRTKTIFKLRFGLGTSEDPEEYRNEHTLEEIGAMLKPSITRERVRQIINNQIAKWKTQFGDMSFLG